MTGRLLAFYYLLLAHDSMVYRSASSLDIRSSASLRIDCSDGIDGSARLL